MPLGEFNYCVVWGWGLMSLTHEQQCSFLVIFKIRNDLALFVWKIWRGISYYRTEVEYQMCCESLNWSHYMQQYFGLFVVASHWYIFRSNTSLSFVMNSQSRILVMLWNWSSKMGRLLINSIDNGSELNKFRLDF